MAITTTICLYAARSVSFIAETPDADLLPLNGIADAAVAAGALESSANIHYAIRIALPAAISS